MIKLWLANSVLHAFVASDTTQINDDIKYALDDGDSKI